MIFRNKASCPVRQELFAEYSCLSSGLTVSSLPKSALSNINIYTREVDSASNIKHDCCRATSSSSRSMVHSSLRPPAMLLRASWRLWLPSDLGCLSHPGCLCWQHQGRGWLSLMLPRMQPWSPSGFLVAALEVKV